MQGSHQQPGPEGSQLQLLAATHATSCINALRPCILLPLAHPKGRFSDPENGGERRCAPVYESQVRALVLPVSTVYSQAQGAFLIGRRKGFVCFVFQPTSGAGMSFSPIVTVGTETPPLLAGISKCVVEPAWTGCVSDHLLLVFHMYPISEAQNPVLRNQNQGSRLSSASK